MEWGSSLLAIEFVHSIETVVIWELNTLLGIFGYINKVYVYISPEIRPSEFQLNCFCLSALHNKYFSTRHFYWFYVHWINHIHALWRPQSRVFFFGAVIARETENEWTSKWARYLRCHVLCYAVLCVVWSAYVACICGERRARMSEPRVANKEACGAFRKIYKWFTVKHYVCCCCYCCCCSTLLAYRRLHKAFTHVPCLCFYFIFFSLFQRLPFH